MKQNPSNRTGVMIVRLWLETNHGTGLRARMTQTLDTSTTERSVAAGASADDICAVVKQWVDAFSDVGARGGNGKVPPGSSGEKP